MYLTNLLILHLDGGVVYSVNCNSRLKSAAITYARGPTTEITGLFWVHKISECYWCLPFLL